VKGTSKSTRNLSTSSLNLCRRSSRLSSSLRFVRPLAGPTFSRRGRRDARPALRAGPPNSGRGRFRARRVRGPFRLGRALPRPRGRRRGDNRIFARPGLAVERDERLEFAQVMSVAERMGGRLRRAVQPAVGLEAVVNDDAPLRALPASRRVCRTRDKGSGSGWPPHAASGFCRRSAGRFRRGSAPAGMNERRDPLDCPRKRLRAAARPFRDAGSASPGAPKRSASVPAVRSSGISCWACR
jgi:hypothetical protein